MTQKTKLEIISPYTPEHEGPFCTRDGKPVRIICTDRKTDLDDCCVVALIHSGTRELTREFNTYGRFAVNDQQFDLMNAREVPVAREFWVNEYGDSKNGSTWFHTFLSLSTAKLYKTDTFIRTIHVREVLPGEE